MIKYIIFDFDGTLVDSKDVTITVLNQMAEKLNFKPLKPEDIEYFRKLPVTDRCKELGIPLYKLPRWAADFYKLYYPLLQNVLLVDGMKEALAEINNHGYRIAVISSNSAEIIQEFLKKNQIDSISQVLSTNRVFGKHRVIKKLLKSSGLKKSEAIYVGDEHRDIRACQKAGIKIIWVAWGFDPLSLAESEAPDYIAHTPNDILPIVNAVSKA
ncbi:MAG: HAD-IA family hydrolase [Firmicutes bacterium]|nr:HAD-IA family hydrolase [Bacillota bacterium]